MKIQMKCPCGAEVKFEDERGSYINGGGAPDEKGRVFIIQVQADEWLELHKNCKEAPHEG